MAGLIVLLSWVLVGLMAGFILWASLLWGIARGLPRRIRERVGDFYRVQAMHWLRRGGIYKPKHGDMTLTATKWDGDKGGEKILAADDEAHARDTGGLFRRMGRALFGLFGEQFQTVFDPVHLRIATRAEEAMLNQEALWVEGADEEAPRPGEVRKKTDVKDRIHYDLEPGAKLVDINAAEAFQFGAASGEMPGESFDAAKRSQSKKGRSMSAFDIMLFGILFCAAGGMVWMLQNVGGSSTAEAASGVGVGTLVPLVGVLPL